MNECKLRCFFVSCNVGCGLVDLIVIYYNIKIYIDILDCGFGFMLWI